MNIADYARERLNALQLYLPLQLCMKSNIVYYI